MMSNVPLWLWMLGGAWIFAAFVVWCALALASICDDQQQRLRDEQAARDEQARATPTGLRR